MLPLSHSCNHMRTQQEDIHLQTRKRAFTRTDYPDTLISNFPVSRTVREKFLIKRHNLRHYQLKQIKIFSKNRTVLRDEKSELKHPAYHYQTKPQKVPDETIVYLQKWPKLCSSLYLFFFVILLYHSHNQQVSMTPAPSR